MVSGAVRADRREPEPRGVLEEAPCSARSSTVRAGAGQCPYSFRDAPLRRLGSSPSPYLRRANWPAHSSRGCSRNSPWWKQSLSEPVPFLNVLWRDSTFRRRFPQPVEVLLGAVPSFAGRVETRPRCCREARATGSRGWRGTPRRPRGRTEIRCSV